MINKTNTFILALNEAILSTKHSLYNEKQNNKHLIMSSTKEESNKYIQELEEKLHNLQELHDEFINKEDIVLVSKNAIRTNLSKYFYLHDEDITSYTLDLTKERLDDCFDTSDLDEITKDTIEGLIENILK